MDIFWIYLNKLKKAEFLEEIKTLKKQSIIFTPNPEILLKLKNDGEFRDILEKASYLIPDGIGIYLAYQILEKKYSFFTSIFLLPYFIYKLIFKKKELYELYWERICGSDLTKDLLRFAEEEKKQIVIIDLYNPTDSKKQLSQKVFASKIKEKYEKLTFDYYIYNPNEKEQIIENISNSSWEILFSTLGMKTQEKSILDIMEKCKNIKIGLWIGSSFDYIVGFQKRAPEFMVKSGFEWFYRIFFWPQKIKRIKRIWNAIFVFTYEVFVYKKGKNRK